MIYKGHLNAILTIKFSPKGYYFASGSFDNCVRLWVTDRKSCIKCMYKHTEVVKFVE